MRSLLLATALALLLAAPPALACSCYFIAPDDVPRLSNGDPVPTVEELSVPELVVFTGEAGEIRTTSGKLVHEEDFIEGTVTTFRVERSWNGMLPEEVKVASGFPGGGCGWLFRAGTRYLVFAARQRGGMLTTSICTRTTPIEHVPDLLASVHQLLGEGSLPRKGGAANAAAGERCWDAGDQALFAVKSWSDLGEWAERFPGCDAGYLAEQVHALASGWLAAGPEEFAALARAAKTSPRLFDVVGRHLALHVSEKAGNRIRAHADLCPESAAEACRRIVQALDEHHRLLIVTPDAGPPVSVTRRQEVAVAGDARVFARSGFDPLVFSPGQPDQQTPEPPGTVAAWRGGALQSPVATWPMSLSGMQPRAVLGERDPYLLLSGPASRGYGSESVRALRYSELAAGAGVEKALPLPTGLRSPLLVRGGIRLFAAGYTFEPKKEGVAVGSPGVGGPDAQNLAIYDLAAGKPAMLAWRERISEHAENNLAAGVTSDGIIHLLTTEVLVSRNNASRVRRLQFDPQKGAWLDDEVLFNRTEFTSTITPRLVAEDYGVEAFWLVDGGADQGQTDGLYAHDGTTTSRLTEAGGSYAVLPDADGDGATLVGVTDPFDADGTVRWFLNRHGRWLTAGETNLGETVYTHTVDETDPFALWRDRSGTVRAAFIGEGKLIVLELKLPEEP